VRRVRRAVVQARRVPPLSAEAIAARAEVLARTRHRRATLVRGPLRVAALALSRGRGIARVLTRGVRARTRGAPQLRPSVLGTFVARATPLRLSRAAARLAVQGEQQQAYAPPPVRCALRCAACAPRRRPRNYEPAPHRWLCA
jgi:hypothetical protein